MDNNGLDINNMTEIPGTAKIRKMGAECSPMELLELSCVLAREGFDKKLWSVLSRVYADKKSFDFVYAEGMDVYVKEILGSGMPSALKLQLYTSFKLPTCLLPTEEQINEMFALCDDKRLNIAAHFIDDYSNQTSILDTHYEAIKNNGRLLKELVKVLNIDALIRLYTCFFTKENKEYITGVIRLLGEIGRKFVYNDTDAIAKLTEIAFEEKGVFFTSKLLFCSVFNVPESCVKKQPDLDKILKISINYEERITKEFVRNYKLHFDISDEAMCKYYIGNKKAKNQRALVNKFACHLVRVEDEETKAKLLRGAFKRGGAFRMYAGCMQDGRIIMEKMRRFHYTDEEVEWCSQLPGLKEKNN